MAGDEGTTEAPGDDPTGKVGSQEKTVAGTPAGINPRRWWGRRAHEQSTDAAQADTFDRVAPLIAVVSGLIIAGLVAGGAIIAGTDNAEKVAASAFTVIGSVVGAYFGIKVGADGTQKAIAAGADGTQKAVAAQRAEAARAQVFAAHLPPESASEALDRADQAASLAQSVSGSPPTPGSRESD